MNLICWQGKFTEPANVNWNSGWRLVRWTRIGFELYSCVSNFSLGKWYGPDSHNAPISSVSSHDTREGGAVALSQGKESHIPFLLHACLSCAFSQCSDRATDKAHLWLYHRRFILTGIGFRALVIWTSLLQLELINVWITLNSDFQQFAVQGSASQTDKSYASVSMKWAPSKKRRFGPGISCQTLHLEHWSTL